VLFPQTQPRHQFLVQLGLLAHEAFGLGRAADGGDRAQLLQHEEDHDAGKEGSQDALRRKLRERFRQQPEQAIDAPIGIGATSCLVRMTKRRSPLPMAIMKLDSDISDASNSSSCSMRRKICDGGEMLTNFRSMPSTFTRPSIKALVRS